MAAVAAARDAPNGMGAHRGDRWRMAASRTATGLVNGRGERGMGRGAWGEGHGERGMGRGAWGEGHGERGMGRGAWGMGGRGG